MKTKILSFVLIASSIFLFSCKEEDKFTSGDLKKKDLTLNVGESVQMEYSGSGCSWQIGDPLIASVTSDGVVTGVHVGKTTLRANWSTCEVQVTSKNNFYLEPMIDNFVVRATDVKTYMDKFKSNYSKKDKNDVFTYKVVEEGKNPLLYDATITKEAQKDPINLNYYPEMSPENLDGVKDASIKTVMRYVYMFDEASSKELKAVGLVAHISNKEFLFNYLADRYIVVSDDNDEEKVYKSIDGKSFVKTKFIDEQSRDKNYNYTVHLEDAFVLAMIVNDSNSDSAIFAELQRSVEESYIRDEYSVSIETNSDNGQISMKNIKGDDLSNGKIIQYGKVVLSAIANEGYQFAGWTTEKNGKEEVVSYQAQDTITVTGDIKYKAQFEKPFEVKVSATEGGSAKVSSATEADKTSLNATKYDELTFEATANEGYQFVNWTDANGEEKSTESTYKTKLEEGVEYKANFKVAEYKIEVLLEGDGNINGTIGGKKGTMTFVESSLSGIAKHGEEVVVNATEKESSEYAFAGWQQGKNIVSTNKELRFNATQDTLFTAIFKKIECNVVIKAGEGGLIVAAEEKKVLTLNEKVEINSKLNIKAEPKKGYAFDKWVNEKNEDVSTSDSCEVTITQDSIFTALFKTMTFNVSASVEGEGTIKAVKVVKEEETEISVDGTSNDFVTGEIIKLKVANIPESSEFIGWRLAGKIVSEEIEYETEIYEDAAYIAVFEKKGVYIKITTTEGGSIEGNNHPRVKYGETLTITAKPSDKYELVGWALNGEILVKEDGTPVVDNPYTTAPITKEGNYKAIFEKVKYQVSLVAGEGGTVSESQKVTVDKQITIQAMPNEGYKFVNWTVNGEEVSKSNPYTTAPITKETEYKANFEKL